MMDWWLSEGLGSEGELTWGADPVLMAVAFTLVGVSLLLVHRRQGSRKGLELACWLMAVSLLVWGISDP